MTHVSVEYVDHMGDDLAELIFNQVHQLFSVAAEAWASRKSHA